MGHAFMQIELIDENGEKSHTYFNLNKFCNISEDQSGIRFYYEDGSYILMEFNEVEERQAASDEIFDFINNYSQKCIIDTFKEIHYVTESQEILN